MSVIVFSMFSNLTSYEKYTKKKHILLSIYPPTHPFIYYQYSVCVYGGGDTLCGSLGRGRGEGVTHDVKGLGGLEFQNVEIPCCSFNEIHGAKLCH